MDMKIIALGIIVATSSFATTAADNTNTSMDLTVTTSLSLLNPACKAKTLNLGAAKKYYTGAVSRIDMLCA
ncbi:TPA: hypothetical protein ACW72W_004050 [Aeromonas veronii]